jgi:hypothetical protein
MLDITALSNALRDGSVSFVSALGVEPFLDDAVEIVRIRGEDALIVPLGSRGGMHPRYALRLPLEHDGGAGWPARYADIATVAGTITGHLPTGVTILDVTEIRGTAVALLYDWVPGETLTARVTRARERHTRDRLGELLWPLADLADALRVSALVHGDIAPGNIVVRPDGGMVLIDLDRVGYRDAVPPVEPRRRVGYRLPRGGGSPEAEDAFALLVLMTSIAVLNDAIVPIDNERAPEWTHPTLLFSSWDLMDPQRSRLVREVNDQLSPLTRELLDRLIAASTGRADRVPALLREATRLVHRSGSPTARADGAFDDIEEGWHLAGPPDIGAAKLPELPGIDAGWPEAPEAPGAWPVTGWSAPGDEPPDVPDMTWPGRTVNRTEPGERSIQAVVDEIRAVAVPPTVGARTRRQQRAERRKGQVSSRLRRALAENDRPVLVELAMSGALAELGESDRHDVLQVVRALSYDAIARAIATDDDEAILASIDRSVFADDEDLDPAFRDRVRLAGEREAWTERVRVAARERDGRASAELLRNPPKDGVERLPEAVRRQLTRLAEEQGAVEAAQQAIRQRDANTLALSLGRLVELHPVWTERIEAGDVIRLLGIEQIEHRLIGLLAGGKLEGSDQWMVDLVIATGRLPEVTRLAGLAPRDVDRMIHRDIEEK